MNHVFKGKIIKLTVFNLRSFINTVKTTEGYNVLFNDKRDRANRHEVLV